MRQLTIPETMAMCDFQAARDDVFGVEWTGETFIVHRVLFDGSESQGEGETLEEAYLAAAMLMQIAFPVDVTDENPFPNIAEAIFWAKHRD